MDRSLNSRVHPLRHFPNQGVSCYVKRDDELGFAINGCKVRKYSSLIRYLKKHEYTHLVIIAGSQSNNLLAALQVARELGMAVTAFLIKPWKVEHKGNFAISSLFLDESEIHWVERHKWHEVETLARNLAAASGSKAFVLNEGASVPEALPGAMTLAFDIANNEQDLKLGFDHIFIEAGTGFSAAGLILGLHDLNHKARVHVLLLADSQDVFLSRLQHYIGCIPNNFECYTPVNAKSFGSVNQTVRDEMRRMAKEEGILTDPVYSAKLFYEARRIINQQMLTGTVLIIHSGGSLNPIF